MDRCSGKAGKQNADLAGDVSSLLASILHCKVSILF